MSFFPFVALNRATTQTVAYVKLLSLTNDAVTFSFSGGSAVVDDWQEIGTDRVDPGTYPRVCYYSRAVITGLTARTRYTWTATQGATTHNGATTTKPEVGYDGDVIQLFATCDWYGEGSDGVLEEYVDTVKASPLSCVGMFYQDDTGYFAERNIDDSANSGILATDRPDREPTEYNYAAAMAAYNFLTFSVNPPGIARLWLMQNTPIHAIVGDHEFVNNYRWKADAGDEFEDVNHDLVYYRTARPVWNAFYGDCMPDPLLGGTFSQTQTTNTLGVADADSAGPFAFLSNGIAFGHVRMVQMDGVSHSTYDATYATNNSLSQQLYSPAELTAAQNYLNQPAKFKQLWISNSFKDTSSAGSATGSKDSWGDHGATGAAWLAQQRSFAAFVEGADELNGTAGNIVMLRGNDHDAQVVRHTLDESSDLSAPFAYEFNAGPVTHAGNHQATALGKTYTGSYTQWTNGGEQGLTRYQAGMVITTNVDGQTIDIVNGFGDEKTSLIQYPLSNNFNTVDNMALYAGVFPLPTTLDAQFSVEQSTRAHSAAKALAVDVPAGYKISEIGFRIQGDGTNTVSDVLIGIFESDASGVPTNLITTINPAYTQVDGVGQSIVEGVSVTLPNFGVQKFTVTAMCTTGNTARVVQNDLIGPCSRDGGLSGAFDDPWAEAAEQAYSLAIYAKFEAAEPIPPELVDSYVDLIYLEGGVESGIDLAANFTGAASLEVNWSPSIPSGFTVASNIFSGTAITPTGTSIATVTATNTFGSTFDTFQVTTLTIGAASNINETIND